MSACACACFTYWDEFLGCRVWANSTRGGTCEHPASGTPEEAA